MAYLIDGWALDDQKKPEVKQFGILQGDLIRLNERGQISMLAQFDGIVAPGLIIARHFFRGLNRRLYDDGSMEADEDKLIHTWRPTNDFDWPYPYSKPRKLPPVQNCTFVVIISPNKRHKENWPEIYGWINRWNWVDEDPKLPEVPLNWSSRYKEKLYTRKGGRNE